MAALIDRFMERPKSQRILFWVGSLSIISFLFWQYSYSPLAEQRNELNDKVEKLQASVLKEQRLVENLPKVREAVKDLEGKLTVALKELPNKAEIPGLLSSISSLAKEAGLDLSLFKLRPENFRDFYAEVPVSIEVEGTFHQVATFFDEVSRLPRIVNISEISVKDPLVKQGEARARTKTACVATTFRYLEESERIKKEDQTAEKGRRRKAAPTSE